VGCLEPWHWANLCRLVGREDFIPEQFSSFAKQKEMYEELSRVFATRDRNEWVRLLDEADISVAPVYDFEEMFSDPHLRHRKVTVKMGHPKLGEIELLNTPFKLSETPAGVRTRPPLWAEHTREVLRSVLDYNEQELSRLFQEGIVE
jgi:crotonobetainyl-CoA:carnitine CoA-transferase CaiB-like acyl-CoA transferase